MLKIHVFWGVTLSTCTVTIVSKEYNASVFRGLMNCLTLKISAQHAYLPVDTAQHARKCVSSSVLL